LPPTPKLVLMALADAADDHGVCWPSVTTLARKCSVSPRTVQRMLKVLDEQELLVAESRHRQSGARSSNRYLLQLTGGDNLSPSDTGATTPRQPCQGPHDKGVTPGTTNRTVTESPQLPLAATEKTTAPAQDSGGRASSKLVFPRGLSPAERDAAERQLAAFGDGLAQQLPDELAARLAAGVIHTSPLAYLRGLIKRANDGTFLPEGGLRVSESRHRQRQLEAARQATEQAFTPPGVIDENDPLVRRLYAIRDKALRRRND
jgi:hypothetical protein